jgi:hypothetical protein
MPTTVKIEINSTEEILKARHLEDGGQAQKFFTSEVKRFADAYTPMDSGALKSNATIGTDSITYNSVYAKYQFYGTSKNGKALNYQGSPMRGKEWSKRMFADRGKEIIQSVASFVGGRAE